MNETYLIIDTSSEEGVVALFQGANCIKEVLLSHGFKNSRQLMPVLDQLFSSLNKKPRDLDFVAVGVGPGSYTGIRVGVVVAKMLHYSLKIPLVGISSLTAYVPEQEGKFASLTDARISGIYLQAGVKRDGKITWDETPQIVSLDKFSPDAFDVLATPHEQLIDKFGADISWEVVAPDASSLAEQALLRFHRGEIAKDGHLDILYLRKTQAELEKK